MGKLQPKDGAKLNGFLSVEGKLNSELSFRAIRISCHIARKKMFCSALYSSMLTTKWRILRKRALGSISMIRRKYRN